MKTFTVRSLFALISFAANSASAATYYKIQGEARALTPIAGVVTSTQPLCPAGVTCIANGTVINLEFGLLGCADELAPITYEAIEKDGDLHVYVSAINLHTKESTVSICQRFPIQPAQVILVNQYGNLKMHYLGAQ
mgnify:CR=1 FL=1